MNKNELLNLVRQSQDRTAEALRQVPPAEGEQAALPGGRSVRDMVAHLTYWQSYINRQIQTVLRGLPPEAGPQGGADVDERNRQSALESQSKRYDEVLREFELSCINLSNTLELLSEEDIFEQGRFAEIDNRLLWKSIADESYEHFDEHLKELDRWTKNRE